MDEEKLGAGIRYLKKEVYDPSRVTQFNFFWRIFVKAFQIPNDKIPPELLKYDSSTANQNAQIAASPQVHKGDFWSKKCIKF